MGDKRSKISVIFFVSITVILYTGCAFDLVHVKQIKTHLTTLQSPKNSWKLVNDISVRLGTGYSRQLKNGTTWDYVGTVEHGDVFRTKDQILTVEASNIYEAYIVMSGNNLVGFYLPVEKTYSPLKSPQELPIEVINPEE